MGKRLNLLINNKCMSKYHKNLTQEQIELMEKLAHHEHARWAAWQNYLHSLCSIERDRSGKALAVQIPVESFERWERQINTEYKDLSEAEKDSDREQVMRYWDLIN